MGVILDLRELLLFSVVVVLFAHLRQSLSKSHRTVQLGSKLEQNCHTLLSCTSAIVSLTLYLQQSWK